MFDRSHPKKTGNFYNWTLTLWGASIDPSKATPWKFPADSKEAHITLASEPKPSASASVSTQHAKPTEHLPVDHGSAPGESHQDFTNGKVDDPTTQKQPANPEADTGYLAGLSKLNSNWLFIAAGVVFVFAASVAAFFIMRKRRGGGKGGAAGGGSAGYEFVPEDDDMELGARTGGARTKELYDAFGDGPSDEDDDDDAGDQASLKRGVGSIYRDDEEEEGDSRFAIGDGPASAITPNSANQQHYRDEETDERDEVLPPNSAGQDDEKRREEENSLFDLGDEGDDDDGQGSGESWQDAAKV